VPDQLKFDYRSDFLRVTSDTVLVPITVQIPTRQLSFNEKDAVDTATMNLFARITTLSGRVVQTFEDTLTNQFPAPELQRSLGTAQIYQKVVPLSPGLYRLDIVIKDVTSGNLGVLNSALRVPNFPDDQLTSSSLILADEIHRVSTKDIGTGQFVLGDLKVRPKLDRTFALNTVMGVFLQVYNLKTDGKIGKASVSVEYRVLKDGTADPALAVPVSKDKLSAYGEELTIEDGIPLQSLAPGKYKLEIAVTDHIANRTITARADFIVKATSP